MPVRPVLEYSCATWQPLNKTLTNRLESVQGFACRVILQSWNLEHNDFLSRTSLPTLEARRDCSTVVQVFKIITGLSSAPNVFIPHTRSDLRRYHHVRYASLLVALRSVKEASFILGWNFGIH